MKRALASTPVVLTAIGLLAAGGWTCSATNAPNDFGSGGNGSGSESSGTHSTGTGHGGAGTSTTTGVLSGTTGTLAGGGGNQMAFSIKPANPVIQYPGANTKVQFEAEDLGGKVTATWSLDNVQLGDINAAGLFTASGAIGGTANVTAQFGKQVATTTITVNLHLVENVGGVTPGDVALLKAGGAADSAFRWLYPFDRTVWPRGLDAPTLQLDGQPADAVWIHVETKSLSFVYDGFYGASSPTQVTPSASTWTAIMETAGPLEDVTVRATKLSGGQATGPKTETWSVAQGTLKGTVYYNSYDSTLANGIGAVLKLKPGTQAQLLSGGNGKCTVCHTVAGGGSKLFAADNTYDTGAMYDLTNNGLESHQRQDYAYNFPAITPDGSLALSTSGQHIGGMWGSQSSQLYDTASGTQIPAPGFDGIVQHAGCPAFSGDGKKIAFDWEDMDDKHTLAVMDFAQATHTFSNPLILVHDDLHVLGWPSFLPDSTQLLFDQNNVGQTGASGDNYGTWFGNRSDLGMVNLATHTVTQLDALNGSVNGQIYLPYGDDDAHRNYEPNVAPLPVGGYNWVVFTSRRQYGNTINNVQTAAYGDTKRKKLWIAAIDLKQKPGTDPSHPAIYLPGQEVGAGNMRGFWVFDPCKANGGMCTSGDECCGGFCREVNGSKTCVPPPMGGCSQEFEKCTMTSDCCNAPQGYTCINGYCVAPTPK